MNEVIENNHDQTQENQEAETASQETRKVKHLIALLLIGLVALAVLFIVLVVKNVPKQPTFEFKAEKESMLDDARPAQLLERLAAQQWQTDAEEASELEAILPSEAYEQSTVQAIAILAEQEQIHCL